jgi:hypothetical protein
LHHHQLQGLLLLRQQLLQPLFPLPFLLVIDVDGASFSSEVKSLLLSAPLPPPAFGFVLPPLFPRTDMPRNELAKMNFNSGFLKSAQL